MSGNVASVIGTAPFRPTHEMKVVSCQRKRNGHRHSPIAAGRATSISQAAIVAPAPMTGGGQLYYAGSDLVPALAASLPMSVPVRTSWSGCEALWTTTTGQSAPYSPISSSASALSRPGA